MANNTQLNPMSAGDIMATADITTFVAMPSTGKLACGALYLSIDGVVAPTPVSKTNPFPMMGPAASAAAKAGNPVQTGAVFNTTQPTVTTGQVVESQATARGATIVATGVDTFSVTATTNADTGVGAGAAPSKALLVAGVFNTALPTLTTGQTAGLQTDSSGRLLVNVAVGGGSDSASSATGSAVPANANYKGINVAGTLRGQTGVNPSGTVYATQMDITSVGGTTVLTGGVAGSLGVGGLAASGATASGNPVPIGGTFNTTQPTVTTGQAVQAQATARGALIVGTGVDTFNVTVNAALPTGANVIGALSANQSVSMAQIAGTATVTAGVAGLLAVGGNVASGSTQAGNPVQIGGTFNTTQPTVTTGQAVAAQYSARGAAIVSTGVDTFNVTVNAALPTGANVIGALSANQSVNLAQVSGTATVTGGVAGSQGVGGLAAVGATAAGNPVEVGGVFNTTPTVLTTGQAGSLQLDSSQNLLCKINTALPTGANVIGALSANQSVNMAQLGGTNTVTGGVAGSLGVGGLAASAAAKAGNPVQTGAVFNTTQPTVTTGQMVESQATARGALIVGTGVDTFNVTVNAALPTGANVIGALSANQSVNLAQVAGTTTVTAGVAGLPAVGGNVASAAADAGNPVKVGGIYNTTPIALTNGQRGDAQMDTAGAVMVHIEGQRNTYSASVTSLAAASGDVFTIAGSGTKTIRVTRIAVSGAATSASLIDVVLAKRSTADTGGTSTAPTAVPHDSNNAAATATLAAYTVAPTTGTLVGNTRARKVLIPALTSPVMGNEPTEFDLTKNGEQGTVLRGTAQQLAINIPTVPAGGSIDIDITWIEDNS